MQMKLLAGQNEYQKVGFSECLRCLMTGFGYPEIQYYRLGCSRHVQVMTVVHNFLTTGTVFLEIFPWTGTRQSGDYQMINVHYRALNPDEDYLISPLLTSCQAARFLTGHRLAGVAGLGAGELQNLKKVKYQKKKRVIWDDNINYNYKQETVNCDQHQRL